MFKDIVVNLSVRAGDTSASASDYAIFLAVMFDAHLTGIAIAYDPTLPESGMGYVPVGLIDQRHDNEAAARAVIDRFTAAAAQAGVAAEPRMIRAGIGGAGDQFGRLARRFDLAIVGRAESESSAVDATIPVSRLFGSGRPVIIVPEIQRAPFRLDRVMVCWDGSRSAARAIADAMPLLERAGNAQVVMIADERGKQQEIEGVDVGQHLARHGVKVEVTRLRRGDGDVADTLLSHAAYSGANFVVMGGYGHSRLREFVLGGVTRTVLRSMAAPTLMSH